MIFATPKDAFQARFARIFPARRCLGCGATFTLVPMRTQSKALLVAVLGAALLLAASASAAMVGIYRNGMDTTAQRSQLIKLTGKDCVRGGSAEALRITLGKATPECSYRTPVVGRNLEIGATARLSSMTPKKARHGAYLGVVARAGAGARYAMLVFPLQRKVQLVKIVAGGAEYLAVDRGEKLVNGVDKANALRLQVVETGEPGKVQVNAFLGGSKVAEALDDSGGVWSGRSSGVRLGAVLHGTGVVGRVDAVSVGVPVRF